MYDRLRIVRLGRALEATSGHLNDLIERNRALRARLTVLVLMQNGLKEVAVHMRLFGADATAEEEMLVALQDVERLHAELQREQEQAQQQGGQRMQQQRHASVALHVAPARPLTAAAELRLMQQRPAAMATQLDAQRQQQQQQQEEEEQGPVTIGAVASLCMQSLTHLRTGTSLLGLEG